VVELIFEGVRMDTFEACSRAEVVALIALPGSLVGLITSMEKDLGPYLVPPEGLSPLGRSLARQSSVSWESTGQYLGTADCEVDRNRTTQRFDGQQGLRVYYVNKVLASLYRSPFLEQVRGLDRSEDGLA
jgi:hypothetical protein